MGDISENFDRSEFACKCWCGFNTVDTELVAVVQDVRDHFNTTVTINSACRCPSHNASVGGSKNSQHLYSRAADVVVAGVAPNFVADYLEETYPGKYGIGRYNTFTHVDTRTEGPARWEG